MPETERTFSDVESNAMLRNSYVKILSKTKMCETRENDNLLVNSMCANRHLANAEK